MWIIGKKRLKLHAIQNKEKRQKNKEIFLKNITIPTSWIDPSKVAEPSDVCDKHCDLPYGVDANMHDSETCTTKRQPISRPIVEFVKFLFRDVSALNFVKMDRTAATYKLREGLSYHNHKELVNKMIKGSSIYDVHKK